MITEYEVVLEYSARELVETINHYIGKGWQPLGGITVVGTKRISDETDALLYVQAIVKQ